MKNKKKKKRTKTEIVELVAKRKGWKVKKSKLKSAPPRDWAGVPKLPSTDVWLLDDYVYYPNPEIHEAMMRLLIAKDPGIVELPDPLGRNWLG